MTSINVNTNPVAQQYASPGERIIEYSARATGGGLIAFSVVEDHDGRPALRVDLYRHDDTVHISVGFGAGMVRVNGRKVIEQPRTDAGLHKGA